jgi:hypothetical protein
LICAAETRRVSKLTQESGEVDETEEENDSMFVILNALTSKNDD